MGPDRSARRLLIALVALLLLALTATVGATPSAPAVAAERHATTAQRAEKRDFPSLPKHCDDPHSQIPVTPCTILSFKKRPTMVVYGDSHALMYLPAIRHVAKERRVNLVVLFAGGCPPVLPPHPNGDLSVCEKHDLVAMDYLKSLAAKGVDFHMIVGAFWSAYREVYQDLRAGHGAQYTTYQKRISTLAHAGTRQAMDVLGRLTDHVDLISQVPVVPPDPPRCVKGMEPYQCPLKRTVAMIDEKGNRRWLSRNTRGLHDPRVIDTNDVYCGTTLCRSHVGKLNTYFDSVHLGAALTRTLTSYFEPSFDF